MLAILHGAGSPEWFHQFFVCLRKFIQFKSYQHQHINTSNIVAKHGTVNLKKYAIICKLLVRLS